MAATSLSGVTLHYNAQRTHDTQYVQARPPVGPVQPTPPQTGPGPPVWTCASLTPAPSTPRSLQCPMCAYVFITSFVGGGWHHGVTKLPQTIPSE